MLNSIQNILLINTSNGLDNRLCLFKSSFESVTRCVNIFVYGIKSFWPNPVQPQVVPVPIQSGHRQFNPKSFRSHKYKMKTWPFKQIQILYW